MKKIKIIIGISGSGKSTWAKAFCQENPEWLRINRDDIRKSMLSVSLNEYHQWDKTSKYRIEKLVTDQHNQMIINALTDNWCILIDNTHLKASVINEYRKLLTEHFEDFEISFKVFEPNTVLAIENDKNRADNVGEEIIKEQVLKFLTLKKKLKFETEIHQRETFKVSQNEALPHCILVDIDGTVAKMNGRYAFDWHRVGEDLPKMEVINLVKILKNSGKKIIFFSGRDESCFNESSNWICKYFEWQTIDFQLFMRKNKDQRKDSFVKFDLFNEHIRDKYFVEFILDDRQQVVDMWRRTLGLTCLQVDYGDF